MSATFGYLPMAIDFTDSVRLYRALAARDARFDGQFFVGVKSTRIYCRPVCRVRMPLERNCRFYAYPAQAEAAGFRPCLRCRPELAPQPGLFGEGPELAHKVMRAIQTGLDGHASLAGLAESFGVTERHLRRVFAEHCGVSPVQYLQTTRLLLAKQLLTDSNLPITDVAFAAGFRSIRRFNASFVEHYRMQPAKLRKAARIDQPAHLASPDDVVLRMKLAFRQPFAARALFEFLSQRAIPGVEQVSIKAREFSYRRTLRRQDSVGEIAIRYRFGQSFIELGLSTSLALHLVALMRATRRVFDLDTDTSSIDAALAFAGEPERGLRLPGSYDRFELGVRAILGQQITVAAARRLAGLLVEKFGDEYRPHSGLRIFPRADQFARLDVVDIAGLGMPRSRAETLLAWAQWCASNQLYSQDRVDPAAVHASLQLIKGIGPWTASYILMRAWSQPDVFLPGDVVLRRVTGCRTDTQMLRRAEDWAPWRSYAVLRLWRQASLSDRS